LLFTAVIPIAVLTATLASPLVSALYGGQWLPAAPVLRFLMILTVVRTMTSFALDILMGAGATRSTLWVNLGWAVALVPGLIVGTRLDGIRGAAISHAVVGLAVAVPLTLVMLHRVGVRLAPIAPPLMRPLFAGGIGAGVAYALVHVTGERPLIRLLVAGSAGLLAYLAVAVPPQSLRQLLGTIRREEAHAVD
jgi:PST family polysaccharide transporter